MSGDKPPRYSLDGRRRVYLISFPKCGRTWLRIMLGRALQQHYRILGLPSFRKLLKLEKLARHHPALPLISVTHDDYPHWKRADELEQDKSRYAGETVLFLVRDPRDVIVSLYFEQHLRVGDYLGRLQEKEELRPFAERLRSYDGTLSAFLREEVGSFAVLLEYLDLWDRARADLPGFAVLTYEELTARPEGALRRTLELFGVAGVADDVIAEAVAFSSFDNLRREEQLGSFRTHKLRPADERDGESYKVRRGKVGGYVDYLGQGDLEYLEEAMAARLSPAWGYRPCREP